MADPTDPVTYGTVTWQAGDVQTIAVFTAKRAEEWLANNAKYIQEAMVEAGWGAMETLLGEGGHLITQLQRGRPPSTSR